jgi:hypothetical protein
MALREFTDQNGVAWKVWDISPAEVSQRLKDEKLFIGYELGWLIFESADGELRRRLCPCPPGWEDGTDDDLERLCQEGEPVAPRSRIPDAADVEPGRASALDEEVARVSVSAREQAEEPPSARRRNLRTFQYPGGRIWTVGVLGVSSDQGMRDVLRFACGAHSVELAEWPDDWERFSDAQLAELLSAGAPARADVPNSTPHRRRRDDLHP